VILQIFVFKIQNGFVLCNSSSKLFPLFYSHNLITRTNKGFRSSKQLDLVELCMVLIIVRNSDFIDAISGYDVKAAW